MKPQKYKVIAIKITSGDKTCANKPGDFCKYLGSIKFGSISVCMLFPNNNNNNTLKGDTSYTILEEKDGWVQRCEDCLKADDYFQNDCKMIAK